MAQEEEKDKTEKASPFKLREAKKRGQVAKSMEFNSFVILSGLLAITALLAQGMISKLLETNRAIFSHAHDVQFDIHSLVDWLSSVLTSAFLVMVPLFAVVIVLSILMNMVQTGPIFSFFPLKPDVKRINPVSGLKRIFSKKIIYDSIKTFIKVAIFGSIIYLVMIFFIPKMVLLMNSDPDGYPLEMLHFMQIMIFSLLPAIFIIAILDLIYSRWEYLKNMMMSRREVKDEIKRREGDPHMRAKIKEVQKEAAKRTKAISKVPDADVLITNPTHLAIAIVYRSGEQKAPELLAKGAGELAEKMRYLARKHRVPIIEDKSLASALFKETDINELIPEQLFAPVARILVWVYAQKNGRQRQQA